MPQRGPLRLIGDADLPAVLDVYRQCEDFLALGPQPTASMAMVLEDVRRSREAGGVFRVIVDGQGTIIGVVDHVPQGYQGDLACAYIALIMIAAPHRNGGLGSEIIGVVEGEIMGNPAITRVSASVQTNNEKALQFWQRLGYRGDGARELQPDGTEVFHLVKELQQPSDTTQDGT